MARTQYLLVAILGGIGLVFVPVVFGTRQLSSAPLIACIRAGECQLPFTGAFSGFFFFIIGWILIMAAIGLGFGLARGRRQGI